MHNIHKCMSIKVGDCLISNRASVNYLGCVLDNDLSGVSMAMKVLGKVNARTKFLARHVSFLDKQIIKLLASCLVGLGIDSDVPIRFRFASFRFDSRFFDYIQ